MYVAIAKNGESINEIGREPGVVVSVAPSQPGVVATRIADFTTALRVFAISRPGALPLPNRARTSERVSHE